MPESSKPLPVARALSAPASGVPEPSLIAHAADNSPLARRGSQASCCCGRPASASANATTFVATNGPGWTVRPRSSATIDRVTHRDSRDAPATEFLWNKEGVPPELGSISRHAWIPQPWIIRHCSHRPDGIPRLDEAGGRFAEELLVLGKIDIHLHGSLSTPCCGAGCKRGTPRRDASSGPCAETTLAASVHRAKIVRERPETGCETGTRPGVGT